ncbi:MAG: sugar phosphate nucleotidyltransferase [Candidatus Micrarchaeota archaeon]|nr:sugar phosphate nucleotidyltransferase [Candidatus Micrarchaeota archaeon]
MKQEKIAITIDPLLLREVEKTIDGNTIKNRSQAIELLLRKALGGDLTTAVMLAGGPHGEAKAMRLYEGRPVLHNLISWLSSYGIHRFIVALDKKEKSIRNYFGDGSRFGVKILYLVESEPSGTAGAIKGCQPLIDSTFAVANCDSIFGLDVQQMFLYHKRSGRLVTMAVKESIATAKYGTVHMEGDNVKSFHEKSASAPSRLINTGFYIMGPEVFRHIPDSGLLERDIFPKLAQQGLLGGYVFTSEWKDLEEMQ